MNGECERLKREFWCIFSREVSQNQYSKTMDDSILHQHLSNRFDRLVSVLNTTKY